MHELHPFISKQNYSFHLISFYLIEWKTFHSLNEIKFNDIITVNRHQLIDAAAKRMNQIEFIQFIHRVSAQLMEDGDTNEIY